MFCALAAPLHVALYLGQIREHGVRIRVDQLRSPSNPHGNLSMPSTDVTSTDFSHFSPLTLKMKAHQM